MPPGASWYLLAEVASVGEIAMIEVSAPGPDDLAGHLAAPAEDTRLMRQIANAY